MINLFSRLGLVLLFIFASCAGQKTSSPKINDENVLVVDVREKDEIKEGMIKDALWLPLSDLKANPKKATTKLKEHLKNKELHIYCRSGKRAQTFLDGIKNEGIQGLNIGGYSDLVSQGFPSEKP